MAMWSPSFSGWLATARPLTYVPLVEPRSVMTHAPCGLREISAWLRDTLMSGMVMSLRDSRPSVTRALARSMARLAAVSIRRAREACSRLGGLLTGYAGAGEHHGVGGLLRRGLLRHGLRLRGGGSGCLTCGVAGGGCRGSGAGGIGVELIDRTGRGLLGGSVIGSSGCGLAPRLLRGRLVALGFPAVVPAGALLIALVTVLFVLVVLIYIG